MIDPLDIPAFFCDCPPGGRWIDMELYYATWVSTMEKLQEEFDDFIQRVMRDIKKTGDTSKAGEAK
jgi:hypothetical protein